MGRAGLCLTAATLIILAIAADGAAAARPGSARPLFELVTPDLSPGMRGELDVLSRSRRSCRLTFSGPGPRRTYDAPTGLPRTRWRFRVSRRAAGGRWTATVRCAAPGLTARTARQRIRIRSAAGSGTLVRSGSMRATASTRLPRGRDFGGGRGAGRGAAGNPFTCNPKRDAWCKAPDGQCTWWAFEKRPDIWIRATSKKYGVPRYGLIPGTSSYWWDAWHWLANAKKAKFPTGRKPVKGAIAVFRRQHPWMPDGHVAYVEAVRGVSFKLSEHNHLGKQYTTTRWLATTAGIDFIYGGPAGDPTKPKPKPKPTPHNPRGTLDAASRAAAGTLHLVGWALDDDIVGPVTVKALIDGQVAGQATASKGRADVGNHGFDFSVPVDAQAHTISVLAVNAGGGKDTVISGARTIPAIGTGVTGDIDGDGYVGCTDKSLLMANYNKTGPGLAGDLNSDGTVNLVDLSILLSNWNPPPGEPSCS